VFGLLFTPSFYILSRRLGDRVSRWIRPKAAPAEPPSEPEA